MGRVPYATKERLVLRPTQPTLRRLAESFLAGIVAGLLWSLWVVPRRRAMPLSGTG